jgi:hypothetical protein
MKYAPYVARLLLRYGAIFLITHGMLDPTLVNSVAGDADILAMVEAGIGAVTGAVAELWYWLAERRKAREELNNVALHI